MLKPLDARRVATGHDEDFSRWTQEQARLIEQRQSLAEVLGDPSLRNRPAEVFEQAHRSARLLANMETGIAFSVFPETPPFTVEQVLDLDFLPDEPGLSGKA